MTGTTDLQGRFTSTGNAMTLQIRSDLDWMEIFNFTQAGTTANPGVGTQFYWQRGMAGGTGIEFLKTNATNALNMTTLASGGFTLVDSSSNPVGLLNSTITAISNAATPIVSLTSTTGLVTGDVVRIINVTGALQIGGYDFTIGTVVPNTSFPLAYMSQLPTAGTTGSLRKINFNPIFYPRNRSISSITKAVSAVVTLTVTHGFTVGQQIRFNISPAFGMTELDGQQATITAVNTTNNTITVNIDTTTYTTFAFPLTIQTPFTPAQVVPIGEAATHPYENLLDDATINTAYIGMLLGAGANGPAGQIGDVIYWRAGTSFSVDNQ